MESKAKVMGHPVHPILVPFPLGLLTTSVIFDVIHLFTGGARWAEISFWMIAAGVIGGLLAAVFGDRLARDTFRYAREGDRVGARVEQCSYGGAVRYELVAALWCAWGSWSLTHRPLLLGGGSRFARGLPRGRAGLPDGHRGGGRGEPKRFGLGLRTRLEGTSTGT
jgi:uncharacterized membrane protein